MFDKQHVIQSMTKYFSVWHNLGISMQEIETFAQWLPSQNFYSTDTVAPSDFQHPKSKAIFELAAQTGILVKGIVIKCPICSDKTGAYMDIDKSSMPEFSRCSHGHVFSTFDPKARSEAYYIKRHAPYVYY